MNEIIYYDDNLNYEIETNEAIQGEIDKNIENIHSMNTSENYCGYMTGRFKKCIILMPEKHNIKNSQEHIGLMNCFDIANQMIKKDVSVPIISFNAQLFSHDIIHNTSSAKSRNIITYKQANAKETWPNIKYLIESDYEERKKILEEIKFWKK